MERLARDKHSSLSQTFLSYGCKKFHKIWPRKQLQQWLDLSQNAKVKKAIFYLKLVLKTEEPESDVSVTSNFNISVPDVIYRSIDLK